MYEPAPAVDPITVSLKSTASRGARFGACTLPISTGRFYSQKGRGGWCGRWGGMRVGNDTEHTAHTQHAHRHTDHTHQECENVHAKHKTSQRAIEGGRGGGRGARERRRKRADDDETRRAGLHFHQSRNNHLSIHLPGYPSAFVTYTLAPRPVF